MRFYRGYRGTGSSGGSLALAEALVPLRASCLLPSDPPRSYNFVWTTDPLTLESGLAYTFPHHTAPPSVRGSVGPPPCPTLAVDMFVSHPLRKLSSIAYASLWQYVRLALSSFVECCATALEYWKTHEVMTNLRRCVRDG